MRNFQCQCGNTIYFENSQCLACGSILGFLPDQQRLSAISTTDEKTWQAFPAQTEPRRYHKCRNYVEYNVCNWMVDSETNEEYCEACRLNVVIPNLDDFKNLQSWYRLETAKRRLLYTLVQLQLPVIGRNTDTSHGLGFQFLGAPEPSLTDHELGNYQHITTGHNAGLITINLEEADPGARETIREQMNESYRTLLGHFRHESGHYYWDKLIRTTEWLAPYRELFGDETTGYKEALSRHYSAGPPPNWQENYISAYASAHPWEDWAESWAHYLHMQDTLDTASHSQLFMAGRRMSAPVSDDDGQFAEANFTGDSRIKFDRLSMDWDQLASALNSLNRSMGLPDAYPFAITPKVSDKLHFIHCLVSGLSPAEVASS